METGRIDGRWRVVIPEPFRRRLRLKPGQAVGFREVPKGLIVQGLEEDPFLLDIAQNPARLGRRTTAREIETIGERSFARRR